MDQLAGMDLPSHLDLTRHSGILHPTDLSVASRTAFRHALKVALLSGAKLTVMHVTGDEDEEDWSAFPGVRQHLEAWGELPPDSDPKDLEALGLRIRKVSASGNDPVAACMDYEERHVADLIVMATSQREGPLGWPHASLAERLARNLGRPTLFIPHESEGFVRSDGTVRLGKVLVPVAHEPSPHLAIKATTAWCDMLTNIAVDINLFHAGPRDRMPDVLPPSTTQRNWRELVVDTDVVEGIVDASTGCDLVVMTTYGRKGVRDAILGSTTERVLRRLNCPLLAVPVHADQR
jgi:nucleotide-binding universal stress UspA family protein